MRNLCVTLVAATTMLAAGSAIGVKAAPSNTDNGAPVANALIQPAQWWGGGFRDRDDRFFFHRRFHRPFFDEFRPFHRRFFHRRFRDCDFDDPC